MQLYTQPIIYKRNIYEINDELISDSYVILDGPTNEDVVYFSIKDKESLILSYDYLLTQCNYNNQFKYPKSEIGDYILSWQYDDINNNDIYNIMDQSRGSFLDLRYIILEPISEASVLSDIDSYNWPYIDEESSSSSSDEFICYNDNNLVSTDRDSFVFDSYNNSIIGYDISYGLDVVVPCKIDGIYVSHIHEDAFCGIINSIVIGNSVTSMDGYVFLHCIDLTEVVIGDGITEMGDAWFFECESLTDVTMGSNISVIGDYSFYGCSSLISLNIPSTVTMIKKYAFRNCSNLESLYFSGNAPSCGIDIFMNSPNVIIYVTDPDSIGWGSTFSGRPVIRL